MAAMPPREKSLVVPKAETTQALMKRVERDLCDDPDEGFYKSYTRECLERVLIRLRETHKLSPDDAVSIVVDAASAMRGEYGD